VVGTQLSGFGPSQGLVLEILQAFLFLLASALRIKRFDKVWEKACRATEIDVKFFHNYKPSQTPL